MGMGWLGGLMVRVAVRSELGGTYIRAMGQALYTCDSNAPLQLHTPANTHIIITPLSVKALLFSYHILLAVGGGWDVIYRLTTAHHTSRFFSPSVLNFPLQHPLVISEWVYFHNHWGSFSPDAINRKHQSDVQWFVNNTPHRGRKKSTVQWMLLFPSMQNAFNSIWK